VEALAGVPGALAWMMTKGNGHLPLLLLLVLLSG